MKLTIIAMLTISVLAFAGIDYNVEALKITSQHKELILPKTAEEVDYNSPLNIKNLDAALQFGMLAFHSPLAADQGSCASCHNIERAGYSNEPFPFGNRGKFDEMMKRLFDVDDTDKPDIRTPAVVNCLTGENMLWGGELGSGGFNKDVDIDKLRKFKEHNTIGNDGVYTQVDVGLDAHNISSLVAACMDDERLQTLSKKAFGYDVSDITLITAIGIYEKSVISSDANFQRFVRGEVDELHEPEGFVLFMENCYSCHSGAAFGNEDLAHKVGVSKFEGRFRLTGENKDKNVVKVPGLYNVSDAPGYFHNAEQITLYKAIRRHNPTIKRTDITKIKRFLQKDLHDNNLKRYEEY